MPIDRARPIRRLIREFAKEASLHWFEHATAQDLLTVKIYGTVRKVISLNFGRILDMHFNGAAQNVPSAELSITFQPFPI